LVTAFDAPIITPLAELIEQRASGEHLAIPAHTACWSDKAGEHDKTPSCGFDGTHRIRAAVLRIDTIVERRDCSPSKGRARIRGGELPAHRLGKIRASRGGGATWRDPGVGTDLVSRNSGCHRDRSHVIGARRVSDKEWSSDSDPPRPRT
jgi:hypothetical protein